LPKSAAELFEKTNPGLTPADWALWWLWNQKEVTTVLSGMNSALITESNLRSANEFRPLTDDESAVYTRVSSEFRKLNKINCTGCNYCLPCPKGINIPACFSAYNTSHIKGYRKGMTLHMTSIGGFKKNPKSPHLCNKCGKCETICPQKIEIRNDLEKVANRFEPLPMRLLMALFRRLMG